MKVDAIARHMAVVDNPQSSEEDIVASVIAVAILVLDRDTVYQTVDDLNEKIFLKSKLSTNESHITSKSQNSSLRDITRKILQSNFRKL